jgi:hypothetical protein
LAAGSCLGAGGCCAEAPVTRHVASAIGNAAAMILIAIIGPSLRSDYIGSRTSTNGMEWLANSAM